MPSTSTTGSNRRVPPPRGLPPRHPSLGIPFYFVKRYGLLRVQGDPHAEVRPLADPAPKRSAFPSSSSICSLSPSLMRGGHFFRGSRTCFPAAAKEHYCYRTSYVIASVYFFRQVDAYRGGRTCFPCRDCVRCHGRLWQAVPYAHFLFHGSHNVLRCASGSVLCRFFSLRSGPNVCCGVLSLRWRKEVRASQRAHPGWMTNAQAVPEVLRVVDPMTSVFALQTLCFPLCCKTRRKERCPIA